MNNDKKKTVILFLTLFLLYFCVGIILSYYYNTANYWNVAFDMDCPRVLGDLSIVNYNHYRASVHPLFIIIFQPLVLILTKFMSSSILSIIFLQSIISTISSFLIYQLLQRILNNSKKSLLITIIFALSSGQILFTTQIETYIYAQFFLILMWYYFFIIQNKEYKLLDYLIIVILGILSLSITITNFIQFIIALFFLFTLNKKNKNAFFKSFLILFCVLAFSVFLATVQNLIWPSAPNFFVKGVNDFINSSSEENLYINTHMSFKNFENISNILFANSLYLTKFVFPEGAYLVFNNTIFTTIISFILSLFLIILNVVYIIKSRNVIKKDKYYIAITLSLLFNLCLHLIYGNSISFLYICHFNFLLLINIIYITNKLFKVPELVLNIFSFFFCLLFSYNIYSVIKIFSTKYAPITYFQKLPFIIFGITLIIIIILKKQKYSLKFIECIIIILLCGYGWYFLNNKDIFARKSKIYVYEKELTKYENQLKNMKNSFMVKNFSLPSEKLNIFFFGMVDHEKLLYKDGKIIRISDKSEILKVDYIKELIIPNKYMVVLEDKNGNIHKIYENEKGIYYNNSEKTIALSTGKKVFTLPNFDKYEYSEILNVLYQEILFNIDGDIPKPNIFGYKSAWYRDAMLATMVLEKTNNVDLFYKWVSEIDSIYDYSRSKNIQEADNLGELLYIIGAVKVKRADLVSEILKEIKNLKDEDNTISGMVDGVIQKYYPTALAIWGAQKNNIDLDLTIPQVDDGYAKLTWYMSNRVASNNNVESKYFPYINWAFYHYSPYTPLYILNENYPLSYEADETQNDIKIESECFISEYYCREKVYLTHMWHASEMFLLLLEY